jgi:drug/metabolite transporter (DMT)-like permease
MTEQRAYVLLLVVIVLWAGNFPLSKVGLGEMSPTTITAIRALLAGAIFSVVAVWRAPLGRPLDLRDATACAVLGLTGLVGNTTVWYWGLLHTTPLNAGIIGATAPMLVALGSWVVLGDRLTPRNWIGIGLSVLAVLVTVAKGSLTVLLELAINRGDLIVLASQALWVVYSIYTRLAPSGLPPAWVMAGSHAVSALVLVPVSLALDPPWPSPLRAPLGWVVVLYGALPVTLGHLWYYAIVRRIGPSRAATFLNLMPFVVIALTWAMLGERVHAYHLVGAALVIGGVVLATRRRAEAPPGSPGAPATSSS